MVRSGMGLVPLGWATALFVYPAIETFQDISATGGAPGPASDLKCIFLQLSLLSLFLFHFFTYFFIFIQNALRFGCRIPRCAGSSFEERHVR
jgi:hypothetical protein